MAAEPAMFMVPSTTSAIPCCKCGIPIIPNGANMCVSCLRSEVDITEGLRKHVIIVHCPGCESYLGASNSWIKADLESKELLKFCIGKLSDLHKVVRVVHAAFIWTEPHSKRIKVMLKVQKEVLNGVILEQSYVVDYVVQDCLCEKCSIARSNPDQWVAVVQLRQHVPHRRTLFHLEQLIMKHSAAARAIKIMQVDQGLDFFFDKRSLAVKFVGFLGRVSPMRSHHDKHLVSSDLKGNTFSYKYTFSVEICPVCREDLICLPQKVAANLGNLGPLVICTKVTDSVALLDPFTLRLCSLSPQQYWRVPFRSLLTCRQLVEYIVLDVEPVSVEFNLSGSKYKLAHVQVVRESDFGRNNNMFYVKTHLGRLLNAGDHALGYDIHGANINNMELDNYGGLDLPEVILTKKICGEKYEQRCGNVHRSAGPLTNKKDIEENLEWFKMSLYDGGEDQLLENVGIANGQNFPCVPLEELLQDLYLSGESDGEDSMKE